jgi:hypothetical protein
MHEHHTTKNHHGNAQIPMAAVRRCRAAALGFVVLQSAAATPSAMQLLILIRFILVPSMVDPGRLSSDWAGP